MYKYIIQNAMAHAFSEVFEPAREREGESISDDARCGVVDFYFHFCVYVVYTLAPVSFSISSLFFRKVNVYYTRDYEACSVFSGCLFSNLYIDWCVVIIRMYTYSDVAVFLFTRNEYLYNNITYVFRYDEILLTCAIVNSASNFVITAHEHTLKNVFLFLVQCSLGAPYLISF